MEYWDDGKVRKGYTKDPLKLLKATLEKPTVHRGKIIKVLAYEKGEPGGALLGSGYVVMRDDGKAQHPVLFDLLGNKLPEGWYRLEITDDVKNCIIPRNIQ